VWVVEVPLAINKGMLNLITGKVCSSEKDAPKGKIPAEIFTMCEHLCSCFHLIQKHLIRLLLMEGLNEANPSSPNKQTNKHSLAEHIEPIVLSLHEI